MLPLCSQIKIRRKHMKKTIAVLAIPLLLAACASEPDFGTKVKAEGAHLKSVSSTYEEGSALISKGEKMVRNGEDKIDEGKDMVSKGRSLIKKGQSLQEDAQTSYFKKAGQ